MLVNLIVGLHNADIVLIGMAVYFAAIDESFGDGWLAREELSSCTGSSGRCWARVQSGWTRADVGVMANFALSEGFAREYSSGYSATRQDSLNDLTSAWKIEEHAPVEKAVADTKTALQLA